MCDHAKDAKRYGVRNGKTDIEYLQATWRTIGGCTKCSEGCANCYAIRETHRLACNPIFGKDNPYKGLVKDGEWTGTVRPFPHKLDRWIHRRKPLRIGVDFYADLFGEAVPGDWQDKVLSRANAWRHLTFFFLTKRPERMKAAVDRAIFSLRKGLVKNIHYGTTVENQARADERLPILLQVPGNHWVSFEPLLGPVTYYGYHPSFVVVGPETGPRRRPCDIAWIRHIVLDYLTVGVPVWVKAIPLPDGKILKDPGDPRWPTWAVQQLPEGA